MRKYRDEVCKLGKCKNVDVCLELCPPLKYVNGKAKSKEILLSNLLNAENIEYVDYNARIAELSEHREAKDQERLEKLLLLLADNSINDRNKLIKAAVFLRYPVSEIADYFGLKIRQIYSIARK